MAEILIALIWFCSIMIVVSFLPLPARVTENPWVRFAFVLFMVLAFLIKLGLVSRL